MIKYFGGVESITIRAGVFRGDERLPMEREVSIWNGRRTGPPARVTEGTRMGGLGVEIRRMLGGLGEKGLRNVRWVQGGLKLVPLKDFVCEGKLEEMVKMEVVEWKEVKEVYY